VQPRPAAIDPSIRRRWIIQSESVPAMRIDMHLGWDFLHLQRLEESQAVRHVDGFVVGREVFIRNGNVSFGSRTFSSSGAAIEFGISRG